jgi:hypothetical protein
VGVNGAGAVACTFLEARYLTISRAFSISGSLVLRVILFCCSFISSIL